MPPVPEGETLVIRTSRLKSGLILLACPVMLAASWFCAFAVDDVIAKVAGWVGLFFFAPCTAAVFIQVMRPGRLTLGRDGFVVDTAFTAHRTAWADIDRIFVWRHKGTSMAAWTLNPGASVPKAARLNRAMGIQVDGSIGPSWPRSPEKMADLLVEWRARHHRDADDAPYPADPA